MNDFFSPAIFHWPEPLYFGLSSKKYSGAFPEFYDVTSLPFASAITDQTEIILAEWKAFNELSKSEQNKGLPTLYRPKGWLTKPLMIYGIPNKRLKQHFPETWSRLTKAIPGLLTMNFAILEPGTKLHPHNGDSNAFYRMHLGLIIPGNLPACGLEVGGKQSGWANGELTAFCDAHFHTAWNYTENKRLVLILDVIRPEFFEQRKRVISGVLAKLALSRISIILPFLLLFPDGIKKYMHMAVSILVYSVLPFFAEKERL